MKNMTELRNELADLFAKLKKGEVELREASELNNTAGKIINTTRAQLQYAQQRNEAPDIPFLK
jgi:adhesin HecA-like repeat protein